MNYAILAYGVIGFFAYLWYAPRALKRRGIKSGDPGSAALWLLGTEAPGLLVVLLALAAWPVVVPLWIWSEIDAKKKEKEYAEMQAREREARANDKYYGMTFDQKLEVLARLAESTESKESNQPLQRTATSRRL
ncbi:hypothetical protein [Actomonas aquatica]|uniref:DUF3302 domain-containing protein n=1 Tax=Actomonas aquatica TaxID=2866162 RepID=A0ABZ1C1Q7_9BACT|nr:hypothetical protein [Opitutus sp. WL0086]WRQ85532.1 hypothetical protein K1X11_012035 [Opitutus sp. WL0086]WRQ85541.1 hypothetical protein K1X11_012080 [Opitutus sp. WL0086]